MGINDLSRYGHSAHSLADFIIPRLEHYSRKYPHCKFVFNSLLLTRDYAWLNREVEEFNRIMFTVTRRLINCSFFDSHHFAGEYYKSNKNIPSFYIQGSRKEGLNTRAIVSEQSNNGIHISLHMRKIISSELVRGIGYIIGAGGFKFRECRWMRNLSTHTV